MTVHPIPSSPDVPRAAKVTADTAAETIAAKSVPASRSQSDQVTISKSGRDALAKDQASPPAPRAPEVPVAALTNDQALQIGKSLQRSNPVNFKKDDQNGDGKLSAAEARAAGLKP